MFIIKFIAYAHDFEPLILSPHLDQHCTLRGNSWVTVVQDSIIFYYSYQVLLYFLKLHLKAVLGTLLS